MNSTSFFSPKNNISKSRQTSNSKNTESKNFAKKFGKGFGIFVGVAVVLLLLLYFFALRPAFSLLSNVNTLKADMDNIKVAMAERDLVELEKHFDKTEKDLADLMIARDKNIGWAKSFGPTKGYYNDIEHFVAAGNHLVDAGRETIVLVKPFADAGGFKVEEDQEVVDLDLMDAFAGWIGIMPEIAEDSDLVLEKLALAGEELSHVDASRYPENFRGQPVRSSIEGAQVLLVQLNDAGPDLKKALTIIPPLLGVNAPEKRYMIMFQNDKELRATGGFWTYFATFRLNNAMLVNHDFTSYGTYNIDHALEPIDPYYTFPSVPGAYVNHLKVERMFARDANISPDLPTAVDQFMNPFWQLAMQQAPAQFKQIDGVFTIDTTVLEELLEVTGPVTLNGVTYTSDSVTLELEKIASLALAEQANRKKILGDLMQQMLINVFESDKNLWPKLVDKGIDLARRKHVQVWTFDPESQALLEKYNFAGRIVDPVEGDYAYAVTTNLGGGKTNTWFVNKDVHHKLEREGERWVRTVSLNYTYGDKTPEYAVFKTIYQDWVRLYVPLGSELISLEGSDDPAGEGEERNKTYFHGYIRVQPGQTKALTFKYYLPEDAIEGDTYNLYLQKQSGVITETHTVEVNGQTQEFEIEMDEKVQVKL